MGRPKLGVVNVTFSLLEEHKEWIEELALKRRTTISQVMRDLMQDMLEKQEATPSESARGSVGEDSDNE